MVPLRLASASAPLHRDKSAFTAFLVTRRCDESVELALAWLLRIGEIAVFEFRDSRLIRRPVARV